MDTHVKVPWFLTRYVHIQIRFTFGVKFQEIPAFPGYFHDFRAETQKSQKHTERFLGFYLDMYINRNA